jgi:hypothetical protein
MIIKIFIFISIFIITKKVIINLLSKKISKKLNSN